MRKQIGTDISYGKTWPLYERTGYHVDIVGCISADSVESAESVKKQLEEILKPYEVEVKVEPVTIVEMLPEDQAEKDRLSDFYLAGLAHPGRRR